MSEIREVVPVEESVAEDVADIVLAEREITEEDIAEMAAAWTYRPPVVGLITASLPKSGPMDVWLGPGPGGRGARWIAEFILWAFLAWMVF